MGQRVKTPAYVLEQTPDGQWQINGIPIRPGSVFSIADANRSRDFVVDHIEPAGYNDGQFVEPRLALRNPDTPAGTIKAYYTPSIIDGRWKGQDEKWHSVSHRGLDLAVDNGGRHPHPQTVLPRNSNREQTLKDGIYRSSDGAFYVDGKLNPQGGFRSRRKALQAAPHLKPSSTPPPTDQTPSDPHSRPVTPKAIPNSQNDKARPSDASLNELDQRTRDIIQELNTRWNYQITTPGQIQAVKEVLSQLDKENMKFWSVGGDVGLSYLANRLAVKGIKPSVAAPSNNFHQKTYSPMTLWNQMAPLVAGVGVGLGSLGAGLYYGTPQKLPAPPEISISQSTLIQSPPLTLSLPTLVPMPDAVALNGGNLGSFISASSASKVLQTPRVVGEMSGKTPDYAPVRFALLEQQDQDLLKGNLALAAISDKNVTPVSQ